MHVMIATDGNLNVDKTVEIASNLAGNDGKITVYTVVEMPRGLLAEMRAASTDGPAQVEKQIGVEYRTTQANDSGQASSWPGDDAVVERYVRGKAEGRLDGITAALTAAGAEHEVVYEEGENVAKSITEAAKRLGADALCVGTHGLGRFEGLLGSASTKLARHAPCSVVLVR